MEGYGTIFSVGTNGNGFTILTNLVGGDGTEAAADLTLAGTTLYGAAYEGGAGGNGMLFSYDTAASGTAYRSLCSLTNTENGRSPNGDLAVSGTILYGTASSGGVGNGLVFKSNLDGSGYRVLWAFTNEVDGVGPGAALALSENKLYGATWGGYSWNGNVFKLNTDGSSFSVIKHFSGQDGSNPNGGGLTLADGVLFGSTYQGGSNNQGVLFKLNPDGTGYAVLLDMGMAGLSYPIGRPALFGGFVYGTTTGGGYSGAGTVFRVDTNGNNFQVLKSFDDTVTQGGMPKGHLSIYGNTLYGTTTAGGAFNNGNIFQMNPDGTGFAVLKNFTGTDGADCECSLALVGSSLYGTCRTGGALGNGVLFRLALQPTTPVIVRQPEDIHTYAGATITFEVAAEGIPAPSYRWFLNNTNAVPGGTNAVLDLTNVSGADAGYYRVVVSNISGSVTSQVALLVVDDPNIEQPPFSVSTNAGSEVQFNVVTSGSTPMSYQWLKDGASLADGGLIFGALSPTLRLSSVLGANAGEYTVVVSNRYSRAVSAPATLAVADPFIVVAPTNKTLRPGNTAEFNVFAAGTMPLRYQWRRNGVMLSGQTTSSAVLNDVDISATGNYDVVVSNDWGSVTSTVAALAVTTILADGFDPGADGDVLAMLVQPDGKILVGGLGAVAGSSGAGLARLQADGTLDPTFSLAVVGGEVFCLALLDDWKVLLGGYFSTLNNEPRSNLGRLLPDGRLDSSFSWGWETDSAIHVFAKQPDGQVLAGSTGYGPNLRRFRSEGALDVTFHPTAGGGGVYAIALQADRNIVVGGTFTTLNGEARTGFGRLLPDGTLDRTFPDQHLYEVAVAIQPDGRILAGGDFGVLRFYPDGTPDPTLNVAANATIWSILVLPDGRILVGGEFTQLGGYPCSRIGRLNADGTVDLSFNPGANSFVRCLALQADGGVLVAGAFTELGMKPRKHIGRLYELPLIRPFMRDQTAEVGSEVRINVSAYSTVPLAYQWYFEGTHPIPGGTRATLSLTNVQPNQSGPYTVVISNCVGCVTSTPVTLQVIPRVPRLAVPALTLMGEIGRLLTLDYTASLAPAPGWTLLDTIPLTNGMQPYFDLTATSSVTRFYRAAQAGQPTLVPNLDVHIVPALILSGNVGDSVRLDCINALGPTNAWTTLATLTLTNTSQLYFDVSAIGKPARLYRVLPLGRW